MESSFRSTQPHASKCLLCRAVSSQKLLRPTGEYETLFHEKDPSTYNNWAKSCIESITRVLKIPSANSNFLNASYCQACLQLMRDVNFTLIQLDNFKSKIKNLRQELLGKLRNNYDAIPNKDHITVCYSDIEIKKNSKNRYTLDEIVKMVYEEIQGHNKLWREPDPIEPIDKHPRICIRIRKVLEHDAVEHNNISINENDFNSKETRSQGHEKLDNYDEQEMRIDEVFSLKEKQTEENQHGEDYQINDADWFFSNAQSINSPTPNEDHEENLPEDNNDNCKPTDSIIIVYRCPDNTCSGRFTQENSLVIHQRKVHEGDPKPYHCHLCSMKYKYATSLSIHVEQHNMIGPAILCTDCGKLVSSDIDLERHMSRVHAKKFQSCSFCDKKFEKEEELIEHEKIHKTSEHPFNCTICLAEFTNSTDLRKHSRFHLDKSYMCDTCGIALSGSKSLSSHKKIHDVNYVGFNCEVCGHIFRSKGLLERHMNRHSDDKKFICDVCGSSFKYNSGLKAHLRKHEGIFPFVCKICDKGFTLSHQLKAHEEIHSGTLSYECPVCQKKFRTCNNFHQHLRTHEPKNPNTRKRIRTKKVVDHSGNQQTNDSENQTMFYY